MNVYLEMVGCRLNQSEIERMAAQFRVAGHVIVEHSEEADLVVVNTCAVTAEAASDSRQKIRQAHRRGRGEIHVTGCWATLDPTAAGQLPGVTRVVLNTEKDELVAGLTHPNCPSIEKPGVRLPLPGARARTRAFIKVQDGCDNHCTFCVTRVARGASRSRTLQEVLTDVGNALAGGAQEVVLSGVNLGGWGRDLQPRSSLRGLVEAVLVGTNPPRLRLSSLEPWDLNADFFNLWQDKRLCRHLHLPLQSGCAATLKRMARKTSPGDFSRVVEMTRAVAPEMAITTDILVGFPGEDEAEFAESLSFIQVMEFAGGHVFSFSPRPGTPAVNYSSQVSRQTRRERNAAVRAVLAQAAKKYRNQFIGQRLNVLWERAEQSVDGGWHLEGLSDNYLRVFGVGQQNLGNCISAVTVEGASERGLYGVIAADTEDGRD
ncbi:MAG: MiaB/RimO family radical SAM methylthiotransferase [Anaerolineaceae bacterium]|nr:MiaB/RimO family radical SAM methylthiotransferase [Anaerolineaceae bacterium]